MDRIAPAGRIDIISDVICPWCYIGKRQLEGALDISRFLRREGRQVVHDPLQRPIDQRSHFRPGRLQGVHGEIPLRAGLFS